VITQEAPHVQPRETSFGEEEATMNVKPMQPLLRGYTSSGPSIHMSCMGESLFIDCDGSVGLSLSNEKYIIILDQETWETRHR